MPVVKKQRLSVIPFVITFLLFVKHSPVIAWPTNQRNDPFTIYTSVDPQYFLYEREKQLMFGMPDDKGTPERLMISFSPFGQNANSAKTLAATYCPVSVTTFANSVPCDTCNNPVYSANPSASSICLNEVPIGDIDGRWNLLGLLAGGIPQGVNLASIPLWQAAFSALFPTKTPGGVTEQDILITSNDICLPTFGYVSVPLKYRKRGIRWDLEGQICGDFGLQFQGGYVEISQVLNPCFRNLTTNNTTTIGTSCSGALNTDGTTVTCSLFDPLVPLMQQLGLDICNFTKWGFEDLYLAVYWRHAHMINANRDLSWPRLLLIPFVRIGGGFNIGHTKEQAVQFSVPFGNGSNSININVGMNLDFSETIEIGAEGCYSHFFEKEFANFRAPTNILQSGIFPFATNAAVQSGDSAYVAAKLAAYHFLDRLSFYAQYVYVHHRKDQIRLLTDDPAFLQMDDQNPLAKCNNTAFRVQLGNFAFTYDVSPSIGLGVLWQQMFHVRNAYNTTTVMFTLNIIF